MIDKYLKKKLLFIILPKKDLRFTNDSSPIKGAIALANYLSKFICVKIIFLDSSVTSSSINKKIDVYRVKSNFLFKYYYIKKIIKKYQEYQIYTLSFCISADLINFLIKPFVNKASVSVRANFAKSYSSIYGSIGFLVAKFHYFLISRFESIFSMHKEMFNHIKKLTNRKSIIAGNFIDEKFYKKFFIKKKIFSNRIIFMGNLDKNKNPILLVNNFIKLIKNFPQAQLIILGDGPLRSEILEIKKKNNLKNLKVLGYVKNPIKYLVNSDILVCTSKSEGISRSVLEALFYGVPVLISNIDGARDIIKNYENGLVFDNDKYFLSSLKKILIWSKNFNKKSRRCLLPYSLRQDYVCKIYLKYLMI